MSQRYHIFSLPPDLLDTLTPRSLISNQAVPQEPPPPTIPQEQAPSSSRSCNICLGTAFVDVDEQRSHFRSDWHRYNVKIRLKGGDPVTESTFAQLVDGGYSIRTLTDIDLRCRARGLPIRVRFF